MQWTNGIVFSPANFPTTNATVEEQLKGILHWSSVSFALKEKFEKQIVKENATINLVDVSVNEIFKELAISLKSQSKFTNSESGNGLTFRIADERFGTIDGDADYRSRRGNRISRYRLRGQRSCGY